jgi:glycosyltransferase involved in cell wall biosynthesis
MLRGATVYTFQASVIIASHNQSRVLELALAALALQASVSPDDFEVIVTDDSSTTDELASIRWLVLESQLNVRLVTQVADRAWLTRARNNAIRVARGRILIFLDGDMIPAQEFVATHLAAHSAQPGLLLAGNRLRRPSFSTRDIEAFWAACRSYLPDPTLRITRSQASEEGKRLTWLASEHPWRAVFGCNMSVESGPEVWFDEAFRNWGPEDWTFACQMTSYHGRTVSYAPDAVAFEVDPLGSGVSSEYRVPNPQAITDYFCNMFRFRECCPGLSLEEYFWGFRKFALVDDEWIATPTDKDVAITVRVAEVQAWLLHRGIHVSV